MFHHHDIPYVQWLYFFISLYSHSKVPTPLVFIRTWPTQCYKLSHQNYREEFILFHKIDKELYKILAINLYHEPTESIQILAMLLWLEWVRFRNSVKKIPSLPNT
ncbi:hypothetical protein CR513_34979, partial [Mucuna pruriens]